MAYISMKLKIHGSLRLAKQLKRPASHIHIMYIHSVLAPLYDVDGHMGAPLHCSTCAGGGGFLEVIGCMAES